MLNGNCVHTARVLGPIFPRRACEHPAGEPRALEVEEDRKTEFPPCICGMDGKWAKGKGQGKQADRLKPQIGVCVSVCGHECVTLYTVPGQGETTHVTSLRGHQGTQLSAEVFSLQGPE